MQNWYISFIDRWVIEEPTFPVVPGHLCDECYKSYFAKRSENELPKSRCRIPDLGATVEEEEPQEMEVEEEENANVNETMENDEDLGSSSS